MKPAISSLTTQLAPSPKSSGDVVLISPTTGIAGCCALAPAAKPPPHRRAGIYYVGYKK